MKRLVKYLKDFWNWVFAGIKVTKLIWSRDDEDPDAFTEEAEKLLSSLPEEDQQRALAFLHRLAGEKDSHE